MSYLSRPRSKSCDYSLCKRLSSSCYQLDDVIQKMKENFCIPTSEALTAVCLDHNYALKDKRSSSTNSKTDLWYLCLVCGVIFKKRNEIREPSRTLRNTTNHGCKVCSRPNCKANQNGHLPLRPKIHIFSCAFCSGLFRQKRILSRHIRLMHSEEKLFIHENSSEKFEKKNLGKSSSSYMLAYSNRPKKLTERSPQEKLFICSYCEKRFRRKKCLEHHIKRHVCRRCSAFFKYTCYMKQHFALTHSDPKTMDEQ
nr:PREDICTED: zinc finger and BTB domain-containing protein 47-like [Bemisia tabaci]XP_018913619.1 PREDICTED: zinc finger and BTB domain-containing protein 47-like [Bemisia tabaci]